MNRRLELQLSQDTSGFYNPEIRLRAGQFVYGPDYTLLRNQHQEYTYPQAGWTWYDSAEQASEATGIALDQWELDIYVEVQQDDTLDTW